MHTKRLNIYKTISNGKSNIIYAKKLILFEILSTNSFKMILKTYYHYIRYSYDIKFYFIYIADKIICFSLPATFKPPKK